MTTFCTTIKNADFALIERAKAAASELNVEYIKRDNKLRLTELVLQGATALVYERNATALHTSAGVLRFHLSMAALRIVALRRGENDNMLTAMQLSPGDNVLDCTLGLGSDALVAAYATGSSGRVVGLEKSPLLHYVIKHGMHTLNCYDVELNAALRRIHTKCADYRDELSNIQSSSYDIVYFDPMFKFPQQRSNAIAPLRMVACHDQPDNEVILNALRVARKRVVYKLEKYSRTELRFDEIVGGKYAAARYGIIHK